MKKATYVQYGCGFSVGKDWMNFDSSPTLRVERFPVLGKFLGRLAGNTQPFPDRILYGDICKGLPVPENSARGAYASHVLEHLSLQDCRRALANTFKLLEPGGTFRLIVPDLRERARRYVDAASQASSEAAGDFMRCSHLGMEQRPRSLPGRLRLLLGGSSHLWMWDEPAMTAELQKAGFIGIRRCDFGDSGDPAFAQVENPGRFVDERLNLRELAIEARKPGPPPR